MNWEQLLSPVRQGQAGNAAASSRSAFEIDYDRIIFSHPFRRLQDKTQVHPLPEHDFVHTRLTHSLEVSSVARSLGRNAGETIIQRNRGLDRYSQFDFGAITAAAALVHDLGNPPFGHAGENALSDFFTETAYGKSFREKVTNEEWSDLVRFEGNAQGFRLLNSGVYGLTLTYPTLGAFTKYPCSSSITDRDKKRKSQKKFGFFQSEKQAFADVAAAVGLEPLGNDTWTRHPLAFLVEAADDICYSIIDLEDGCRLGLVSFNDTVDLLAGILKNDFDRAKLERHGSENEKIAVLRALAINKLIRESTSIFLDHEAAILIGSFDEALTDHCPSRDTLEIINQISVQKIYRARLVVEIEASGHEVLPGLLHEFATCGDYLLNDEKTPRKYQNIALLLPGDLRQQIRDCGAVYGMLRLVLDFVSGLTDRHALSLYRKMKGISV